MGELDARRAVAAERGPEAEGHPAGLEEADLVVGLLGAAPAERLVEGAGAGEVGHAEGHQTDALVHGDTIAGRVVARLGRTGRVGPVPTGSGTARPRPHMER